MRGDHELAARVRTEHPDLLLRHDDTEELPRWASAGDDEVVARLLDAGVPLDARGIDDGTALQYAGMWGRASTVELLLARGAEVEVMGGPREHPGTALAWTAWGSRALPNAAARLDGYLGATAALLAAGARVTEGMIEAAADEVAVLLEPQRAADRGWRRPVGSSRFGHTQRHGQRDDTQQVAGQLAPLGTDATSVLSSCSHTSEASLEYPRDRKGRSQPPDLRVAVLASRGSDAPRCGSVRPAACADDRRVLTISERRHDGFRPS